MLTKLATPVLAVITLCVFIPPTRTVVRDLETSVPIDLRGGQSCFDYPLPESCTENNTYPNACNSNECTGTPRVCPAGTNGDSGFYGPVWYDFCALVDVGRASCGSTGFHCNHYWTCGGCEFYETLSKWLCYHDTKVYEDAHHFDRFPAGADCDSTISQIDKSEGVHELVLQANGVFFKLFNSSVTVAIDFNASPEK